MSQVSDNNIEQVAEDIDNNEIYYAYDPDYCSTHSSKRKSSVKKVVITGGCILLMGLGLGFNLIKVPIKKEVTVVAKKTIVINNDDTVTHSYTIPEDYEFSFDNNGQPIGYKYIEEEGTLNEYINSLIFTKK